MTAMFTGDSLTDFKRRLLKVLTKFSVNHTIHIAQEEIRKFMTIEITDHEHMVLFLSLLAESNDHMKLQQKKEYLKIFGNAAEIFEDALIPYLPKVLNTFNKRTTEQSIDLH
jgi:hypothetical protein